MDPSVAQSTIDANATNRIVGMVVAGALVVALAIGAIVLAGEDGISAFQVNGVSTSQRSVDDELRALAENRELARAVAASASGASLSETSGSIVTSVASGWIGLRIGQEVAAQEVARQHLPTTADARTQGEALAIQSVSGDIIFRSLPQWFQDRLLQRWTLVAVDQLQVVATNRADLDAQVRKDCASGRYITHILVKTQADSAAVVQQLAAGADFAKLAATRSTDASSAGDGGELGCLDSLQLPDATSAAAVNAVFEKVSDPIQLADGSFDILLVHNAPGDSDLRKAALGTVLARAQQARVRVDARYGRWDRTQGVVVPPKVPVGAGTATAAPAGA
jgi:hypothetical protein